MNETKMRPIDLPEHIAALFQRWTHVAQVQIPEKCGLCGRPSKGNWFTGYYLPCVEDGWHDPKPDVGMGRGVAVFTEFASLNYKRSHSWARLTWRKRMTQWLRGDERRDFEQYHGLDGHIARLSPNHFAGDVRPTLGGSFYTLPSNRRYSNKTRVIFAETLSQWNLTPTSALSKATPQ